MDQGLLKDLFDEEGTHWWHIAKRRLIRDFLPKAPGKVLVLGIGGGRLCSELSGEFAVTAADISPLACRHLKERYALNAIECDFNKDLPFGAGQFNAVIVADVLEHILDDKKFLDEIKRCLAQEGVLILTVPAYAHMWSSWDDRLHHHRRYEYDALKDLMVSCGFAVKKMSFFNALIYPPALIRRKFFKIRPDSLSDFKVFQGGVFMKMLMGFYYAAERRWLGIGPIPFGLSLFVCAQKA
jgi:SAM-dependent methyltransferase